MTIECAQCDARVIVMASSDPLVVRSASRRGGWELVDGKDLCPEHAREHRQTVKERERTAKRSNRS